LKIVICFLGIHCGSGFFAEDLKAFECKTIAAKLNPSSSMSIRELWIRYKQDGGIEVRNLLIETYLPLVKYHSDKILETLPRAINSDDLLSEGFFGLLEAIEAFDLDRGVKFETFSALRIRGAILDSLRALDFRPKSTRSRSSAFKETRRKLREQNGWVEPTDDQVFAKLGVLDKIKNSVSRGDKLLEDSKSTMRTISISRRRFETDSGKDITEGDMILIGRDSEALENESYNWIRPLRGLIPQEKLAITLYFKEYRTMKEIGEKLGVTEGRASQIIKQGLEVLKSKGEDLLRDQFKAPLTE